MRKYRNTKIKIDSLVFDSKLEASHYLLIKNRLRRGEIKDLARQVKIQLTFNAEKHKDKVCYIADFVFFDLVLGEWVIWDSKGMKTKEYVVKRKWLLDAYFGFVFIEATAKKTTEYKPYGGKKLIFK